MKARCKSLYREGRVVLENGRQVSYSPPGRVQIELLQWWQQRDTSAEIFLTRTALVVSDERVGRYAGNGLAVDSLEIIRITDLDQIGAEVRKAIALYDRLCAEYASLRRAADGAQAAVPF